MVAMARKDVQLAVELASDTATSAPVLHFIAGTVVPELDASGFTG